MGELSGLYLCAGNEVILNGVISPEGSQRSKSGIPQNLSEMLSRLILNIEFFRVTFTNSDEGQAAASLFEAYSARDPEQVS